MNVRILREYVRTVGSVLIWREVTRVPVLIALVAQIVKFQVRGSRKKAEFAMV